MMIEERKETENLGQDINPETGNFIEKEEQQEPQKEKQPWRFETSQEWAQKKERMIGKGAECVVVELDGSPREVVAFRYGETTPEKAKQIYYTHRIFSTLFPHNFPHFSMGFAESKKDSRLGGTVRQKIEGRTGRVWEVPPTIYDPKISRFLKKLVDLANPNIKYPFSRVTDFCRETGTYVGFDPFKDNYMVGADSGQYFVDTIHSYEKQFGWDFGRILKYMDENDYNPQDKRTVMMSLERLKELDLAKNERKNYL